MAANVVGDFGERGALIDGAGGHVGEQGEIAGRGCDPELVNSPGEIVLEASLAAFGTDFTMDEVVGDEGMGGPGADPDATGAPFVMGVYPMLLDETCYFLAVDFDGDAWMDDARAFCDAGRRVNLPVALERSRSGNGGHVWFFFAEAMPAALARKLGSAMLTIAQESRPEIGLKSYDRLFPNQDTLPTGGFGNLIALPLQREARSRGNSVFVDDSFVPYPDQWQFLSRVPRLACPTVQSLVREAEGRDRVVGVRCVAADLAEESRPWALTPSRCSPKEPIPGPLPSSLEIVFADQVYLPKAGLPPALRNRLVRLAAFQNPEFLKAQALRLPAYDLPRIVACAEDFPQHIGLPRGCLHEVEDLLEALGIGWRVRDERNLGQPLPCTFVGELRPEQRQAAEALLKNDTGVLAATTAFGKTVVTAWLIAARGVNTLVSSDHLHAVRPGAPPCRCPATGRRAALHPSGHRTADRFLGAPRRHRQPRADFQRVFAAVAADEGRNAMICDDVLRAESAGRSILVLTERTEHLEALAARLLPRVPHAVVLRGGMSRWKLREDLLGRRGGTPRTSDSRDSKPQGRHAFT